MTVVPDAYHGPAGEAETEPEDAGLTFVVSWYSTTQIQVIEDVLLKVKDTLVPLPEAGTSPVPVQPVQTYLSPVGPDTGDVTEAVTGVPDA